MSQDPTFDLANIEQGIQTIFDAKQSQYLTGEEMRDAFYDGFLGLELDQEMHDALMAADADASMFQDILDSSALNYLGIAGQSFTMGLGQAYLDKIHPETVLTLKDKILYITSQGASIQESIAEVFNNSSVKTYIDKATGALVQTEQLLSETTHIPIGSVASTLSTGITAYEVWDALKDPAEAIYEDVATNQQGSLDVLREYAVGATSLIAGASVGGALSPFITAVGGGAVGAVTAAVTKDILDDFFDNHFDDFLTAMRSAGATTGEMLAALKELVSEQVAAAYAYSGPLAQALLDEVVDIASDLSDVSTDLVEDAGSLVDDYIWAAGNADTVAEQLGREISNKVRWISEVLGGGFSDGSNGEGGSSGGSGGSGTTLGGGTIHESEEDRNDSEDRDERRPEDQENDKEDAVNKSTPLILDLDNSGDLSLVSYGSGSTYFDIDGDGAFAEDTGWIDYQSSADGFLVADWNGDGVISGVSELFGTSSHDGFYELAQLDENEDQEVNVLDSGFEELQIWIDGNGNGYSESEEIYDLSNFGVVSISTTNIRIDQSQSGNLITNEGSFRYGNGGEGKIFDVWFEYDNQNSTYNETYSLDVRALFLPSVRGYGDIPDLHISSSLDNGKDGLLHYLNDIYSVSLDSILSRSHQELRSDIYKLLFMWADVDAIDPSSRGPYIDARELSYIEKMTGEPFLQKGHAPNPGQLAAGTLEDSFRNEASLVFARILMQGVGTELFNAASGEEIYYDLSLDRLFGVDSLNQGRIDDLVTLAQTPSVDALEFWTNVMMIVRGVRGDLQSLTAADQNVLDAAIQASDASLNFAAVNNYFQGYDPGSQYTTTQGNDEIIADYHDDNINGQGGNDVIYGYGGDDFIDGSFGDDELFGGAGSDILDDNQGENEFTGGQGGDLIRGSAGADIYYYFSGDGDDAIEEGSDGASSTNIDEIVFGAGITLADLTFTRLNNNRLEIAIDQGAGGGSIIIEEHFASSFNKRIELITFSDSSTFDPNSLSYTLDGADLAENLYGVENGANPNDIIFGNGGNDSIWGNDGLDVIHGGDGDDTIHASDGTSLGIRETHSQILNGDAGWDFIHGAWGVDAITGGTGNDSLKGYRGADHYYFDYGDGDDLIAREDGLANETDTIHLGSAITLSMLSYTLDSSGYDLTIIVDGGAGGSITIDQQFASDNGEDTVEQIILADTTIIDLQYQDFEWFGSDEGEILYGRRGITGGNDTIHGLGGDDNLYGEDGNDFLYGGAGNDLLRGDAGDDTLNGGIGNNTLEGGGGTDIADYSELLSSITVNRETGVLIHGQFTDMISEVEEIIGTDNNDTFIGHDDFTDIHGGEGSDTLDYTIGSASTRDKVIDLGVGTASAPSWGLNDNFSSIENVITDEGQDTITGSASDNLISTGAEADSIDSLGGDDILIGGAGNDDLDGGDGVDRAHFTGNYADYTITDHTTYFTVTDNVGTDGTDTIVNVEFFGFADQTYDVANSTLTYNPIAQDDEFTTTQDATITGLLWADNGNGNDTDPDGDPRTYDVDDFSANGATLNSDSNGWFMYIPTPGYYGTDTFNYVVSDGNGGQDTGTVTVTVLEDTTGAPTVGRAYLYDGKIEINYIFDSVYINTDDYLKKTHAIAFETGSDVTSTQMLYEQGGGLRGLNMFIDNGNLYGAVWNLLEENWGYKELATGLEADTAYTSILVMDGELPADGYSYLYQNGVLVDSTGGVGTGIGMLYAHDNNIGIGQVQESTRVHDVTFSNPAFFDGEIQKLIHYNVALSGTDIDDLSDYLARDWLPGHFTRPTLTEEDRSIYLIDGVSETTLASSSDIDTGQNLQKTHAMAFETGSDVTTTQVLYEQGGQYRGMNLYIHNGSLYAAVWEKSTENWGYVEVSAGVTANTKYTVTFEIDSVAPSNGTAKLYLNGIEVDSDTGVGETKQQWGDIGVGQNIGITRIQDVASSDTDAFGGTIDKILQYNAILEGQDKHELEIFMSDAWLPSTHMIYGLNDDDTLNGTSTDEVIHGYFGDDILYGDDGSDVLIGGLGADTMTGGNGADTFFIGDDAIDTITDFATADGDVLNIAGLLTGYDPLTDAITDFVEITDDGTDSTLKIDADGGADSFVTIATLSGVTGLTDEDALEASGNLIAVAA